MTGQSPALPNHHPAPARRRTSRWQYVHMTLAHALDSVPEVELRTYLDPREAVERAKQCGPDGCSPGCRRARNAGVRSYVREAS